MLQSDYRRLERYMLDCMKDAAHDKDHVYRVLFMALDITRYESDANQDIIIAACLLHDIGREAQLKNPDVNHAAEGGNMAYEWLSANGWPEENAACVRDCIRTHSYRIGGFPATIEAKIVFDADKLDAVGSIGIARTLLYKGQVNQPLYSLRTDGTVSAGTGDRNPSFFHEYKFKLESLYDRFYTQRGKQLAARRRQAAADFYNSIYADVSACYENGREYLDGALY